jgi:hypothetical protein
MVLIGWWWGADLTLGLVERLVAENKGLRERMDLAGEALVTLEERAERDAATIRHLREALDTISAQHRALQDKHAAMALLLQPSSPTSSSTVVGVTSSSSSTSLTSLTATPSSGSASLSAPASASVSPRGTSPRPGYHYGIGATSGGVVLPQHPHTLSQTPRSFHNSFPSLTSPRSPSRPAGPFSPRNGEGLVSPATSPRRRLAYASQTLAAHSRAFGLTSLSSHTTQMSHGKLHVQCLHAAAVGVVDLRVRAHEPQARRRTSVAVPRSHPDPSRPVPVLLLLLLLTPRHLSRARVVDISLFSLSPARRRRSLHGVPPLQFWLHDSRHLSISF